MPWKATRWPLLIAEHPDLAKKEILAALKAAGQRLHVAAAALGISRDTLRRSAIRLGVELNSPEGRAAWAPVVEAPVEKPKRTRKRAQP